MYSPLEKYQKVNACETAEELKKVILSFADEDGLIQGRRNKFTSVRTGEVVQLKPKSM